MQEAALPVPRAPACCVAIGNLLRAPPGWRVALNSFKEKTVNHLLFFLQPWVVRFNPELPQLLPKGSSRAGNAGAGMSSVLAVVGGFQARKDFKSPGSLIPVVGHQGG